MSAPTLSRDHQDALRHVASPRTIRVAMSKWPAVMHPLIAKILYEAQVIAEGHLRAELAGKDGAA